MAYTTQTEIEAAFSAATILALVDDAKVGSVDTNGLARITAAITAASQEIDAYCRRHYSVPFVTTPPIVEKLATDLAGYYLYRRRMAEFGTPEDIKDLRAGAVRQLEQIAKGILDLGVEPQPTSSAAVVAVSGGPDALFDATTLEDF
jgi:phage gp36-like protein